MSVDSEEEDVTRRIVLHVYDDESKEFTSLTTYHGMIRIYSSETWPSRIFWCLVVVTCVTLFMIHSGMMLTYYASRPTFMRPTDTDLTDQHLPAITICRKDKYYNQVKYHSIPTSVITLLNLVVSQRVLTGEDRQQLIEFQNDWKHRHNATFDFEQFIKDGSPLCESLLVSLRVGDRLIPGPCRFAQLHMGETGACWRLAGLPTVDASDEVEIEVDNPDDLVIFQVHSAFGPARPFSKGMSLRKGFKALSTLTAHKQSLLSDWGTCKEMSPLLPNHSNNLDRCERECLARQFESSCGCVPFYARPGTRRVCSPEETDRCRPSGEPLVPCGCAVECTRFVYEISTPSYLKTSPNKRHLSTIHLSWSSPKMFVEQQDKRFKMVDLLSFVAGSMGLFLGMSCVTLLEIFMYLFKSVWGAVNDDRHSAYLEKLLGEAIDHDADTPHDEIVILQTKNNEEEAVEERAGQPQRRMSLFRGQRRSKGRASDSSAGVGSASASLADLGNLRIQLVRPNAGRRASTYGVYDF